MEVAVHVHSSHHSPPWRRAARVVAVFAVLAGPLAVPTSAQLGAIRDAARRAADEAKKAEEAKRQAEEAKKGAEGVGGRSGNAGAPAAQPAAAPSAAPATVPTASATGSTPTFEVYSKYDFVPGEKVVAIEDFAQDAIGDFPDKWNTNASGEVVTVAGQSGRWLKLTRAGFFMPEFITDLPENFTLEFDLVVRPGFSAGFPLEFAVVQLASPNMPADWESAPNILTMTAFPGYGDPTMGMSSYWTRQDGGSSSAAQNARTPQLAAQGKPVHVSMWRQRQRVRVYMNEEKIWDVPRAVSATSKLNSFLFFVPGGCGNCEYYLANLRLATGAPDTRNKLLTEGKWVTHGIYFDVNSDRVRADSYGSLKEIAGVLAETADVKVTIVGHTDSDGDEAANLDLSKRRAASVKNALVSQFKIDAGRMDTDGKGESEPVDRNDNAAGKANNRRVEFIKK